MSDTRTYIVPDGQENSTNQMLPWMAMMNGGMGGFGNGMWNNPFMYLVWMWMMRWMNRGEFGDGNSCQNLQSAEIQGQLAGLREQMNTNQNTQLLMDAIKGNSAALGQLATNLNCDFGVLKDCCCNIQNAIATVGGQVGYTSERVINAVERGNCDVIQAISSLSVTVTANEVQFDFNNHRNIGAPFRGLLIVRLNQAIPAGTTTTLPIVFTSGGGGNAQKLTGYNGADITVSQIPGTGIYLCWFEHSTNTLQLLTGVV